MPDTTTAHSRLDREIYRGVAKRAPPRSVMLRLFSDWEFVVRAVRHVLRLPTPLYTEDRRVLERIIFRHYVGQPDIRSVLFVGCDWYTRHYGRTYFGQHDFWTIDPAESARKFGARQHVIAPLERLDAFFPEGYFDLIFVNGVFGYGLDSPEQCEAAFGHCYTRLRAGGQLLFGWDEVPERTPFAPSAIESLRRFQAVDFPPLGTQRYLTDTSYRHVYEFYAR